MMKTTSVFWQPRLNAPGEIVQGHEDIVQAIQIILRTACGSDPHRPEFGSQLHRYMDMPIDRALPHVVREAVNAIQRWEPRCRLLSVKPQRQAEHLSLRIQWTGRDHLTQSTEWLWR